MKSKNIVTFLKLYKLSTRIRIENWFYSAGNNVGGQRLLTAGIWYMTAQKAFTMIKMTAEFFLVLKIKFLFNLGSILFN